MAMPNKDNRQGSRSPSYSPITPPARRLSPPLPFDASTRPVLTHNSAPTAARPPQTVAAPVAPLPNPIDLSENPDAVALRSAIAILQMQKRRAEADVRALQRAKAEALADPEAFVNDLMQGKVKVQRPGDAPLGPYSDDDEEEEEEGDGDNDNNGATGNSMAGGGPTPPSSSTATTSTAGLSRKRRRGPESQPGGPPDEPPRRAWASLPAHQEVVRAPPINWAQYAVVGDALNRLHSEQVAAPSAGAPARLLPDGSYAEPLQQHSRPRGEEGRGAPSRYLGVSAPYEPTRDRIERPRKGGGN